jgi:hypothetical protein
MRRRSRRRSSCALSDSIYSKASCAPPATANGGRATRQAGCSTAGSRDNEATRVGTATPVEECRMRDTSPAVIAPAVAPISLSNVPCRSPSRRSQHRPRNGAAKSLNSGIRRSDAEYAWCTGRLHRAGVHSPAVRKRRCRFSERWRWGTFHRRRRKGLDRSPRACNCNCSLHFMWRGVHDPLDAQRDHGGRVLELPSGLYRHGARGPVWQPNRTLRAASRPGPQDRGNYPVGGRD